MKTIKPFVKRWYDALEEGKILGVKCPECGNLECPPVPVCNKCGCHELEWTEIDGRGTLVAFDDCSVPLWGSEIGPVLSGVVRLEEGTLIQAAVLGVPMEERADLWKRIPLEVKAEVQQRDGFKYPAFRVVEK